jgi:hypothetical protein
MHILYCRSVILISIVLSLTSACSQSPSRVAPIPQFPFPVLSARGAWSRAVEAALEWSEDAQVVDLRVSFDRVNSEGVFNTVDFGFESPTKNAESLWVICGYDVCTSEVITESDSSLARRSEPITLEDFQLDGRDALAISLDYGGRNFVPAMREEYISVFAKLSRLYPVSSGGVYWRVSYLEPGSRDHLDVIMDAKTGEVVEVQD